MSDQSGSKMKEEILRILNHDIEDLPRRKRRLYDLIIFLSYFATAAIRIFLGSRLPFGVFLVIVGAFCLLMLYWYFVLKAKRVEIRRT